MFIRNRVPADDRGLSPHPREIELRNLLAKTFSKANISLLVSNTGCLAPAGNAQVIWDDITVYDDVPEGDWRVSPKGWSEMFNRLDIRLSSAFS
ncbi:MAG: hypothetical protein ACREDR_35925 [Blastocatellia bacterium]